ncbi:VapD [Campylobacter upsaliensis]
MSFGNSKKLKSIAFDLDTKALKENYTKGDWHNAYNDINSYLNERGFKHTQGSVYDSTTKFSDEELGDLIEKMCEKLTWLPQCVKSIRGYDQPIMIDYTLQLKDKFFNESLTFQKKKAKALKHLKRQSKKPKVFLKVFQNNNSKNLIPS